MECEPDVRRLVPVPGDNFVVLASDGLWDVLSDQEAVDCANAVLKVGEGLVCWPSRFVNVNDSQLIPRALPHRRWARPQARCPSAHFGRWVSTSTPLSLTFVPLCPSAGPLRGAARHCHRRRRRGVPRGGRAGGRRRAAGAGCAAGHGRQRDCHRHAAAVGLRGQGVWRPVWAPLAPAPTSCRSGAGGGRGPCGEGGAGQHLPFVSAAAVV